MTDTRFLPIPQGIVDERVDRALSRMLGLSRAAAADLCAQERVIIAGLPIKKSDRLVADGILEVQLPKPAAPVAPMRVEGMEIVWEDDDIVVVDKPIGVAAHPAIGWDGPTVTGALAAAGVRIATSGAQERQGVVSRLDVGTSGLMLVTKTEQAYGLMKAQFKHHEVEKTYHALVQGCPMPKTGTIEAPIGRDPNHSWRMCISNAGKDAITHYRVVRNWDIASLLEVNLETGRTHQIRVHMSAIKHPCVGDPIYGANPVLAKDIGIERQWLHSYSLRFKHPVHSQWVEITSPQYPADLQGAIDILDNIS